MFKWGMHTLRLLLLLLFPVFASAQQDPVAVKQAVENWLKVQTKGLPGMVSYDIGSLDPGNQLAACRRFDVTRPTGTQQLWARGNVQVRCLDEAGWRVFIPVHVRVKAEYLISARPIGQGQVLVADDITSQTGDLSELPPNILMAPELAIGKAAASSISMGRPLRADMLKAQTAIRQGQTVQVISKGAGFAVTNEGKAINNALEGQVAQVRLTNGQVVSGIARAGGIVDVSF